MLDDSRGNSRKMLLDLTGLRINLDKLFIHPDHCLLVVSRLAEHHASESPSARLEKQQLHEKLLELMENCHYERDAMWMRSRMEPRLWARVYTSTSWVEGVELIRIKL